MMIDVTHLLHVAIISVFDDWMDGCRSSAGKPIDDVHRLIMFYKQSKIIQEWLVLK